VDPEVLPSEPVYTLQNNFPIKTGCRAVI
jgi:hypothetical protein